MSVEIYRFLFPGNTFSVHRGNAAGNTTLPHTSSQVSESQRYRETAGNVSQVKVSVCSPRSGETLTDRRFGVLVSP